jgi:hypothetical protein
MWAATTPDSIIIIIPAYGMDASATRPANSRDRVTS